MLIDVDDGSGVEQAYTITISAGRPVMITSERKDLERVGYCSQLGQNIIVRIVPSFDSKKMIVWYTRR